MNNRTFTMIKPDAVEKGFITSILDKISVSGFKIIGLKLIKFSKTKKSLFNFRSYFIIFNTSDLLYTKGGYNLGRSRNFVNFRPSFR